MCAGGHYWIHPTGESPQQTPGKNAQPCPQSNVVAEPGQAGCRPSEERVYWLKYPSLRDWFNGVIFVSITFSFQTCFINKETTSIISILTDKGKEWKKCQRVKIMVEKKTRRI